MTKHPIYALALEQASDWERHVAHNMEIERGSEWYYQFAHAQTIRDYVMAPNEARRLSAMRTMLRDAVDWVTAAQRCLT